MEKNICLGNQQSAHLNTVKPKHDQAISNGLCRRRCNGSSGDSRCQGKSIMFWAQLSVRSWVHLATIKHWQGSPPSPSPPNNTAEHIQLGLSTSGGTMLMNRLMLLQEKKNTKKNHTMDKFKQECLT